MAPSPILTVRVAPEPQLARKPATRAWSPSSPRAWFQRKRNLQLSSALDRTRACGGNLQPQQHLKGGEANRYSGGSRQVQAHSTRCRAKPRRADISAACAMPIDHLRRQSKLYYASWRFAHYQTLTNEGDDVVAARIWINFSGDDTANHCNGVLCH